MMNVVEMKNVVEVKSDVENVIEQYKEQLAAGTDPLAIVRDIVKHKNYNGAFDQYVITKSRLFLEINNVFDSPEYLEWISFMLADLDLSQDVFLIRAGKPVNVTKERVEDLIYNFKF